MSLLIFIAILVALIIVHELGHFAVAKWFGIGVDEFSVFFPPKLFSLRWRSTNYSLGAIPLGGFVSIQGESVPTELQNKEKLAAVTYNPKNFFQRSYWVQALVIVAGIVCNIIFAWILLSAGYFVGLPTSVDHVGFGTVTNGHTTVIEVLPNSPAAAAGIQANDVIEGATTATATLPPGADADAVSAFIIEHQDQSVILSVDRNGEQKNLLARPVAGLVPGHKAIGIAMDDVGTLKLSLPLALAQGGLLGWDMVKATAQGLGGFFWGLVSGGANFSEVSGPIGIAGMGAAAVTAGWSPTLLLTALISINLGLINLIPVPGLDGGRLLFILIEGVRRKPIPERVAMWATIAGFGLLILLVLVVSYHDILNLIHSA
jgi:regulator of sigma E protease